MEKWDNVEGKDINLTCFDPKTVEAVTKAVLKKKERKKKKLAFACLKY